MVVGRAPEIQMPPGSATPQACRDVNAVAEEIAILDHHVAHIDPDAELDALLWCLTLSTLGHSGLHGHGALDRGHCAWELDENGVPAGVDDTATMSLDLRINDLATDRLEAREGATSSWPMRRL